MNSVTTLADALVADLNEASFSQPFTAERAYLPLRDLPDFKNLRVTVLIRSVTRQVLTRRDNQEDIQLVVAIQKRVDPDNLAEVDALVALVHEIADQLDRRRLTDRAVHTATELDPLVSQEHLLEQRVFTSVLTLTYRILN